MREEVAVTNDSRKLVFVPSFARRALYYLQRVQTREKNRRPPRGKERGATGRANPIPAPTSKVPKHEARLVGDAHSPLGFTLLRFPKMQ